jgi:hypothetical protein
MHHCIASYARSIGQGQMFAYHLELNGEACSLMVEQTKGRWALREISGLQNAPASREAQAAVRSWLEQWQGRELEAF